MACKYCALHNVEEPCIKLLNPKYLNPGRDIVIPDDCKINSEDGMMYHYAFSGYPEFADSGTRLFVVAMWKKFRAGYGGFIPCISLRHAILVAAYQNMSSVYGESKAIQHRTKACAALSKLTPETLDDGDLLATFILCGYSLEMGWEHEKLEHLKGIANFYNQLNSNERNSRPVSKFAVLRPLFSSLASHLTFPHIRQTKHLLFPIIGPQQLATVHTELFGEPREYSICSVWTAWTVLCSMPFSH